MRMARKTQGLAAVALALAASGLADPCSATEPTLGSAAASTGRYFGAALDPAYLDEKPYDALAATQLTCVTPENQMKWDFVEPLRGTFNWRTADTLVAFAKANGQKLRG